MIITSLAIHKITFWCVTLLEIEMWNNFCLYMLKNDIKYLHVEYSIINNIRKSKKCISTLKFIYILLITMRLITNTALFFFKSNNRLNEWGFFPAQTHCGLLFFLIKIDSTPM